MAELVEAKGWGGKQVWKGVGHGGYRQEGIRMAVHHRRRGGAPLNPLPPQTKVTIVGKNEIYNWENLVGPFLVRKLLGPRPPF